MKTTVNASPTARETMKKHAARARPLALAILGRIDRATDPFSDVNWGQVEGMIRAEELIKEALVALGGKA